MLNLLKNGEVIRQVVSGSALNHDGAYTSPAVVGWRHGEYELVEAPPLPEPPEPTLEELREKMPVLTPRQFRDILADIGIFSQMVTDKINKIPFDIERQKALNAWEVMTEAVRVDPYIDMIGAMFGKSPEDIDLAWPE